jgi:HEAT repeat protein
VGDAVGTLVGAAPPAAGDVVTDAEFALVHLLKRGGQLDEATARLREIGRRSPGRAREAELQLAELALARYDTGQALVHAGRAADGADGPMLARIADLELRAGDQGRATASYRAAVNRGAGPVAALALVRLLERSGDTVAAAGALDELFRLPDDDEAVAEAGRLAIDLGELAGTLPDLEQRLAGRLAARDTPARRRLLVTVLKRLLPPLYRDPGADGVRAHLAPHALRALLDLVTSADQPADPGALELVGMLGNADATPAIARLLSSSISSPADAAAPTGDRRPRTTPSGRLDAAAPAGDRRSRTTPSGRLDAAAPAGDRRPRTTPSGRLEGPDARMGADGRLSAVIALGRLGDPRGRAVLERLVATADPNLRAASVWALGRIPGPRSRPLLLAALQDRRSEVVMAAALGLGRLGEAEDAAALCRLAADGRAPLGVRRAAIVALARTASRRTTATLFELLDGGDDELARAAALALAWSQDPAATDGLLARAVLPRSFALGEPGAPLAALDAIRIGAGPPDEARALPPARLDLDAVLAALVTPPPHGDLTPLLRAHAGALVETLARALAREGDARTEAAVALDGWGEGLRLGAVAEAGDGVPAPDTAAILRDIVLPLADRLAPLLDAPEPETRAAALRVLARLGDERVTPARVAAAVRDGSAPLAAAAAFAAGQMARARPGTAPQLAAALTPALADESWRRRLAAVDALAALGPAGLPALDRARADGNSIIRAAADEAHRRPRGD